MMSLSKPTERTLSHFLARQSALGFSYDEVGATAGELPAGYVVDRTRIELGRGESVYAQGRSALGRWEQFRLEWVESWPAGAPLERGTTVAILGRVAGLWWLNACRIVYVVDETGPVCRFGFAYGTLPGHVERGEERFVIEWDRASDQVRLEILAFSRPNHVLARLGYPLVRRCQKRFGRESAAALFQAVRGNEPLPAIHQRTRAGQ